MPDAGATELVFLGMPPWLVASTSGVHGLSLVSVSRFALNELGVNPLAELSVLLMDVRSGYIYATGEATAATAPTAASAGRPGAHRI